MAIHSHLGETPIKLTKFQVFLFLLALEILLLHIKSKPEIEEMKIFGYKYLYSAYAADTTFFLKYIISINHMVDTFFPYFLELKPSLTKSKIAGIYVLKGVQVAVCGIRCTDLNKDMLKIVGIHLSYN